MKIISAVQEKILQNFGTIKDSDQFYLTGGTALAHFYLQHRQSNDLDFFTSIDDVIEPFSRQLEVYLQSKKFQCQRQRGLHSFVELVVTLDKESTLIHLALDSSFRFEPTTTFTAYPQLKVDSLVDIASNKLLALFGRATFRDFVDVYFLVQKGKFSKQQLLDGAQRKDPGFDLYWLAVAFERINTFADDSQEMLLLIEPISLKELQNFFNHWRQDIAGKLKP